MSSSDAVLLFDGHCQFCSRAAAIAQRTARTEIVPLEHEASQTFLSAQFDSIPFSLVLADFEHQKVHVGRNAARKISDRAGLPSFAAGAIETNYESLAQLTRETSDAKPDFDLVHETVDMTENAFNQFDNLLAAADSV